VKIKLPVFDAPKLPLYIIAYYRLDYEIP